MTILPTSITAARNLADALRDGRWDDVPRLNTVWQQADPIGHTLWHAAASAAAETGGEVPSPCEFCASCRERAADAERFVRANLATTTATAFWYRMQLASDRRRLTAAATPPSGGVPHNGSPSPPTPPPSTCNYATSTAPPRRSRRRLMRQHDCTPHSATAGAASSRARCPASTPRRRRPAEAAAGPQARQQARHLLTVPHHRVAHPTGGRPNPYREQQSERNTPPHGHELL